MNWKEDDIVLCNVKKIEGTTVFVELEEDGTSGTIVLSEVAAGRIRNLRQYVLPNKRIVCKVLRVCKDHLELSLRRVTSGERDEVMSGYKKERALSSVLKVVGVEPSSIISKIKSEYSILEFFEAAREDPKIFEKFLKKSDAEKVAKIFCEKEGKDKRIERKVKLTSLSAEGVEDIQSVLDFSDAGVEIHYLGSSVFSVAVSAKEFKEADAKMVSTLDEISKRAKKKDVSFEVVKK